MRQHLGANLPEKLVGKVAPVPAERPPAEQVQPAGLGAAA